VFGALRYKNEFDAQAGAQRLFEQIQPFDANQAFGDAAGTSESLPQLFEARILLAYDSANRHKAETF
jgi:hypothetical protein